MDLSGGFKKNKYKISVITPLYKVEDYIEKCCHSLFQQPLEEIEYIFVDDCSPDSSNEILLKVLEGYPSRRMDVKIIRHESNLGVACARNTGLENASGEYVLFVDADDWLESHALKDIYETACNGNYDIIGYDWYLEFSTNRRYLKQPVYDNAESCFKAMLAGELRWYLWAFMVRRSLYEANKFRFIPGLNVGEDMMMLLKLFASAKNYKHISKALYHYIQTNKASITQLEARKQLEIVKQNADEAISYLRVKYGNALTEDLHFLMLNLKFPLLITDNSSNYDLWNASFEEANISIWKNKHVSFRSKLLQWMAMNRQYWFLKVYYKVLFKFVYGVLYR